MSVVGSLLLLFEDAEVRSEELAYALELARRLRCRLTVLMLVEPPVDEAGRRRFEERIDAVGTGGVELAREFRCGDKASELLKFLALNPSVGALVWGSDGRPRSEPGDRGPQHWLMALRSSFSFPIVKSFPRGPRVGADPSA